MSVNATPREGSLVVTLLKAAVLPVPAVAVATVHIADDDVVYVTSVEAFVQTFVLDVPFPSIHWLVGIALVGFKGAEVIPAVGWGVVLGAGALRVPNVGDV